MQTIVHPDETEFRFAVRSPVHFQSADLYGDFLVLQTRSFFDRLRIFSFGVVVMPPSCPLFPRKLLQAISCYFIFVFSR